MKRLEANLLLFIITFYAAIQYVFLAGVPSDISNFLFLAITNMVGFFMALLLFFGELTRLEKSQLKASMILSLELIGVNFFILLGSSGMEATVSSGVLSAYFIFTMVISVLFLHQKPTIQNVIGSVVVLAGLFLVMGAQPQGFLDKRIGFLLVADVFYACYVITVERMTAKSNPAILAMGQMFFTCIFSWIAYGCEMVVKGQKPSLPMDSSFWVSVFFISFFIRGLYGIVQIYAQRYVSALNVSLIFSTELLMTMLMSPVLAVIMGTSKDTITPLRLAGGVLMIFGILETDGVPKKLLASLKKTDGNEKKVKEKKKAEKAAPRTGDEAFRERPQKRQYLLYVVAIGMIYLVLDLPLRLTDYFDYSSLVGLKSFLPAAAGLLFGGGGIGGCVLGAVVSFLIIPVTFADGLLEIVMILLMGLGTWLLWHLWNPAGDVTVKSVAQLVKYVVIVMGLSVIGGVLSLVFVQGGYLGEIVVVYGVLGVVVGLPVVVLFTSIVALRPVLPPWKADFADISFRLENGVDDIALLNEQVEEYAMMNGIPMKKSFGIQNNLEELILRMLEKEPGMSIDVRVYISDSVSIYIRGYGERYNPLRVGKEENREDLIGLQLIRSRSLRASWSYRNKVNYLHIVS